jgi:hypothetical protein
VFAGGACGDPDSAVFESKSADTIVGPPVTRSEVILTADTYARLHWTMTTANLTGVSCGGGFVSDYPPGDRVGVGYKWGGWNDVDDFLQKIEQGYGTGTGGGSDTYSDYSIDCVAGVSCTGFVSRAWRLNEKYTLCYPDPDIPRKFCEITDAIEGVDFARRQVDALRKGDAFINDYHTILYVYQTRDGKPVVMDSSYPGVRFRKLTWGYLASEGYTAIRYRNIVETAAPPGTIANPIVVRSDTFPYQGRGNTRDVVSMEFDRYATAQAVSQVGPEVVYRLELTTPGTVVLSVTDVTHEGINNDIHLLRSLDRHDLSLTAMGCVAAADNVITTGLDAGVYYVVVDSSVDLPGEYTLFMGFR